MCIPNRISARLIFPFCRFCKIPKKHGVPQITHLPCLADNAGYDITEIISFSDKERKLKQWSFGM